MLTRPADAVGFQRRVWVGIEPILWRVGSWLLALAVWEVWSRFLDQPRLFPGPLEVLSALVTWWSDGILVRDAAASLRRVGVGLLIGASLGLLVGSVSGTRRWIGQSLGSIVNSLRALPPVALVPLAILWLGISENSKVFLVAWGAFFPVWLNTHIGVSRVDRAIAWAAMSLGARGRTLTLKVVMPAALPQILAGVRLAIGIAFICVFVAELAGASEGIGFRISTSHLVFRADLMLAGLVVLAALGAAADGILSLIVRQFAPWLRR